MNISDSLIVIRGGGDLASGVALRLHRAGLNLLITERQQPLAVRRLVSFGEAIYRGQFTVEGVTARFVNKTMEVPEIIQRREIPVLTDPNCESILSPGSPFHEPLVLIDARMTKQPPELGLEVASLVIGLGPGFVAGQNCHAAIETNRGHYLGRVIWQGAPEADTGIPGTVARHQEDRVLRAPIDGKFSAKVEIGSLIKSEQLIAEVSGKPIIAPFDGILRGLIHDGISVQQDTKVGDLDPRSDSRFATLVSEKSLAVGGGVLEALLTRPKIRERLWS
jgi:xanthine dehydrogenase accessory factor